MTIEELQIVISAKTESVHAKIDKLKEKIASVQPKKAADVDVTTGKAQGNLKKLQAEIDRTQAKIQKLNAKMADVYAKQDAIVGKYSGVPNLSGMSHDQTLDFMVGKDPKMQEFNAQLDQLEAQTAPLKAHLADVKAQITQAGNAAEPAAAKTRQLGESMRTAGGHIQNAGRSSSYFGRMVKSMLVSMALYQGVSFAMKSISEGMQNIALGSSKANVTLSQLATSALYLKNSIAAALMPALHALTSTITWLSNQVANLFNTLGMLGARIFGGSTTYAVAQRAQVNYAETLGKAGSKADETKKKVKELQRTVMGFDSLNVLSKPTEASKPKSDPKSEKPGMPAYGDMFKTVKIPSGISAVGDKIKALLSEWRTYAQPTIEAFDRLKKSLEPLKTFAAKGLEDFYHDFLKPVGVWTLGTGLPALFNITSNLVDKINWTGLNAALANLWTALAPFTIHVGGGLLWFYDKVISPVAQWAANNLIPVALGLVSNAIMLVDRATQALRPLGEWLYNTFLVPLGKWTGGIVISALSGVSSALKGISDWVSRNQSAVQTMTGVVLGFFAAWKATELLEFITNAGGVVGILGKLKEATWAATGAKVADRVETIKVVALYAKDFVTSVAAGTVAMAKQVAQWAALKLAKAADIVKTVAQTAATKLATLAQGALNIVLNANPIALVVLAVGGLVAAIVVLYNKCAWFRNGFKSFVNGIVWGINQLTGGINSIIGSLNSIHINVPQGVPMIGGQTYGFNIPTIPKIPYLASGGLITGPTYSLIGEGKDNEAVLPLSDDVYSRIGKGIQESGSSDRLSASAVNGIYDRMDHLEAAIKDIAVRPVNLYADDRRIAESSNRGNRQIDRLYHPIATT